ncbi:MAG: nucleoside-diphosphate sugar epimerase/dehydratase [Arenimonas sp.]
MTRRWPLLAHLPRALVVAHDIAIVVLVWQLLHWLAGQAGAPAPVALWEQLAVVLVIQAAVFWRVGLYRGVWRFASVPDLMNLASAAVIAILLIVPVFLVLGMLPHIPRRVLLPYPLFLVLGLGLPRLAYRLWKDHSLALSRKADATRVLILGAGRAGEMLLRELRGQDRYHAVGLLDDVTVLKGAKIQGVQVLGTLDDLGRVARETAATLLVITMPSASSGQMRRVVELCDQTGLPFRKVSRLSDQFEHDIGAFELREVAIEDLLGREPVAFDWQLVHEYFGERSVLITGAGGSIGSELAHQCAQAGVGRLLLLERHEQALEEISQRIRADFPQLELLPVLADCADVEAYRSLLQGTDFVIHAAACKQVPMLEEQVRAALRNNVQISAILARACRAAGVRNFLLVSTDKAIEPASVLGASKSLAEQVCQALLIDSGTRLAIVRFGNVLDSAGSVVPLFREQIARGGPVTVTHPDVTRYFMTIPEACQLILQTSKLSVSTASVFTLDMGQPVAIRDLAEQMIRLAGKHPGRDIQLEYTGLRPGEKLHETVFHPEERHAPTLNPRVLRSELRGVDAAGVLRMLERLDSLLKGGQGNDVLKAFLRENVHDYRPAGDNVLPFSHPGKAQTLR